MSCSNCMWELAGDRSLQAMGVRKGMGLAWEFYHLPKAPCKRLWEFAGGGSLQGMGVCRQRPITTSWSAFDIQKYLRWRFVFEGVMKYPKLSKRKVFQVDFCWRLEAIKIDSESLKSSNSSSWTWIQESSKSSVKTSSRRWRLRVF